MKALSMEQTSIDYGHRPGVNHAMRRFLRTYTERETRPADVPTPLPAPMPTGSGGIICNEEMFDLVRT